MSFKVVKAFFYQIQSMYPGRTVLIYTNEYEALSPDQPIPFVLVADRRKTGAQILRKYEKSRHPDVFPKDLLQVVRTTTGLQVNGRKYELLREVGEGGENAVPQTEVSSRKTFSSARLNVSWPNWARCQPVWNNGKRKKQNMYRHICFYKTGKGIY